MPPKRKALTPMDAESSLDELALPQMQQTKKRAKPSQSSKQPFKKSKSSGESSLVTPPNERDEESSEIEVEVISSSPPSTKTRAKPSSSARRASAAKPAAPADSDSHYYFQKPAPKIVPRKRVQPSVRVVVDSDEEPFPERKRVSNGNKRAPSPSSSELSEHDELATDSDTPKSKVKKPSAKKKPSPVKSKAKAKASTPGKRSGGKPSSTPKSIQRDESDFSLGSADSSTSEAEAVSSASDEEESAVTTPGTAAGSATPAGNSAVGSSASRASRPRGSGGGGGRMPNMTSEERTAELLRRRLARVERDSVRVLSHHPELADTWEGVDLEAPVGREASDEKPMIDQPAEMTLKLLPFQREGVAWMVRQEEETEYAGGILADEMGMGKTLQAIGLILHTPVSEETDRRLPTLVLTPTVALMQWESEIIRHTLPSTLRVLVFHGGDRTTDPEELIKYDVVLSTYAIVEAGFRKERYGVKRKGEMVKEPSAVHGVEWYRIILDEAHSIKDRTCSTARAVFALKAAKKWSLSGTPLQNRVGELYSLIRFLKCDPYSYYYCKSCDCKSLHWAFANGSKCDSCGHKPMVHFNWWNAEILKPITNFGHEHPAGALAFRKLARLLDKIMLRRTKVQKADDLGLPPKVVVVRRDYFNEEEEDLYNSLYGDAKRKFDTFVAEETVLNNYANIFELLMKMRQAANHPDLVTKKKLVSSEAEAKSLMCGICNEPAEDAIVSKCKHTFCREDAREYIESSVEETPKCPVCFRPLSIDLSQEEVIPQETSTNGAVKKSIINYIDMSTWRSSTKIEALVEELTNSRRQDATVKSIVFSQFVNFLDLVQWRLKRSGFECVKLDGRMTPQQRDTIIKEFMTNVNVVVFLISLKAGGIALNLTEASNVFLMDPWWNPAVEEQAMDRIHRLGQHRPIKITRIIVENSIESRIIHLQEKKKAMFESTVGKDMSALARLTEEDFEFLFRN